jgi:RimJ/RimL family protein N-acetyltransferase
MGTPLEKIVEPSLEAEKARIQEFLTLEEQEKQLTWMIQFREKTVGAVWVELEPTNYLPAPAIHIMIGDPSVRGQGIGENTVNTVLSFLRSDAKYDTVYSRHLVKNQTATVLLEKAGFEDYEDRYKDADGLEWQNVQLYFRKAQ